MTHQPITLILTYILSLLHREMAPILLQKTGSELIWFKTFNDLYLVQCEGHNLKIKKKESTDNAISFTLPKFTQASSL